MSDGGNDSGDLAQERQRELEREREFYEDTAPQSNKVLEEQLGEITITHIDPDRLDEGIVSAYTGDMVSFIESHTQQRIQAVLDEVESELPVERDLPKPESGYYAQPIGNQPVKNTNQVFSEGHNYLLRRVRTALATIKAKYQPEHKV